MSLWVGSYRFALGKRIYDPISTNVWKLRDPDSSRREAKPFGLQWASAFSVLMDEKAAKNSFELVQDDRLNLAAPLGKFSFCDCVVVTEFCDKHCCHGYEVVALSRVQADLVFVFRY